jgi:hypothetical protein
MGTVQQTLELGRRSRLSLVADARRILGMVVSGLVQRADAVAAAEFGEIDPVSRPEKVTLWCECLDSDRFIAVKAKSLLLLFGLVFAGLFTLPAPAQKRLFTGPLFRDLRTDPSFTFEPALRFVGGVLLHARQLGERVEVGIAIAESE